MRALLALILTTTILAFAGSLQTALDDFQGRVTKLTAVKGMFGYSFGAGVGLADSVCVVGTVYATLEDDFRGTGAIQVFRPPPNGGWASDTTIALGSQGFYQNGEIAATNNTIATAVTDANGHWGVLLHGRDGKQWTAEALLRSDSSANAIGGSYSVSLSGDICVVGAYRLNRAWIFKRFALGEWGQVATLQPDSVDNDGWSLDFGLSVSVAGDVCVVGARGEDIGAEDGGAAYVFRRTV